VRPDGTCSAVDDQIIHPPKGQKAPGNSSTSRQAIHPPRRQAIHPPRARQFTHPVGLHGAHEEDILVACSKRRLQDWPQHDIEFPLLRAVYDVDDHD
jgi:hypothetical protein